jgi:hypothetical protein
MYLDRHVCLNSSERDSQDSIRVKLGLVREGKSPDYKYVPWIMNKGINQSSTNNSRRIATPVLGFLW